jgi:hypothetical protein
MMRLERPISTDAPRESVEERAMALATTPEYELTHRSPMFLYLRLNGIASATTRRRLAMQATR